MAKLCSITFSVTELNSPVVCECERLGGFSLSIHLHALIYLIVAACVITPSFIIICIAFCVFLIYNYELWYCFKYLVWIKIKINYYNPRLLLFYWKWCAHHWFIRSELDTIRQSPMKCARNGNIVLPKNISPAFNTNHTNREMRKFRWDVVSSIQSLAPYCVLYTAKAASAI